MTATRRFPLKIKLAFFATLLVAFVAISLSTYIRSGQKQTIVQAQHLSRLETVKYLAQVAREAILVDDDTDMVNYLSLLRKSPANAYAMVLHENGSIRVHTDATQIGKHPDDEPTRKALALQNSNTHLIQMLKGPNGQPVIDISVPITVGINPPVYRGVARIGFDKNTIDQDIAVAMRKVDQRIRAAFVLGLILGVIGAFLLSLFITRPIEIVRRGAREIGAGRLDHRITVNTNDELKELADDFNLMAQKLSELDQMKQDFVSNVTHELRSPMTSIRGYIDLLLQDAAGPLNADQKDFLSVVKNSAVRLGRFIDNLLDVAKIEAHKLTLTPESLDLHGLAHEMVVLFKPQADEKSIQIVNQVPKTGATTFADKDKLAEVFINLVSNAIKFTPDKGTVTMTATEGPNYLEVGVHDTGPGIPADMVGKLFSKFEQVKANQGHARKHKGTGLGLTIAKGIIEAHGGKIWIKSPGPSGGGTTFFFTVPKMTAELKAKLAE